VDELVCMSIDEDTGLISVGSQSYIFLIDPRSSTPLISKILSNDDNYGVRSVSFRHSLLTIGGGRGKLSFFDICAGKYLQVNEERTFLQTSTGFVLRDALYNSFPPPMRNDIVSAIYTHCWSPNMDFLFSAGGPLMIGLKGCCCSLWN